MDQRYFNDAIIGNKNMTISFSRTGELLRLFNKTPDYKQFFEFFHVGVKINDSSIIYLHQDVNNVYDQNYEKNTNVLVTDITNMYFNLQVRQIDFAMNKENILVKRYRIKNNNLIDLKLDMIIDSKVVSNFNNDTCGYVKNDALLQYNHDYTVCTFSKNKLSYYQINDVANNIFTGTIGGKDYIGMSNNSAIGYDLGLLKPGDETEIDIYVFVNDNDEKNVANDLELEIERIRKISVEKEYEDAKKYWRNYVKKHKVIETKKDNKDIDNIYARTILLMPLLVNQDTGGISAGVEVDEYKTKSGRYSYCWLRDAVYITKALDTLKMNDITENFYKKFCKMTQSRSGGWEQRFYTDGRLAPSWGYQIDETASVIYGVYQHYLIKKDKNFLKDTLKMCENAVKFIEKYLDDVLNDKNKIQESYDLWEENEGISLYSMSAIYASYIAKLDINKEVKELYSQNRLKIEQLTKETEMLEKRVREIKAYINKTFFDEDKKTYVRNVKDRKMDISILGAVTPFNVFSPKEKKVLNTVEKMNMTLRTYTGGYIRYESDFYMGGHNPWIISCLWMAEYCLEAKEEKKALELFEFVLKTATKHGFLGEQVSNEDLKPIWVIGLTWSHAMFIRMLEKLTQKGLI